MQDTSPSIPLHLSERDLRALLMVVGELGYSDHRVTAAARKLKAALGAGGPGRVA